MIPIGDENRRGMLFPIVNIAIILVNFLVFFVELSGGDAFIIRWAFIPARFLADPAGDFITIFTAMFMQASWAHILGNMLYLWIFGDNIEDRLGHFKYLIFYLLSGIIATFAQLLVNPTSTIPNLGASGAIAGVLGAYLILFPHGRIRVLLGLFITTVPAILAIGLWILLQFVNSFGAISTTAQSGGVAYMAHIGGFFAGIILTFIMRGRRQELMAG